MEVLGLIKKESVTGRWQDSKVTAFFDDMCFVRKNGRCWGSKLITLRNQLGMNYNSHQIRHAGCRYNTHIQSIPYVCSTSVLCTLYSYGSLNIPIYSLN